tara:strand:- start:29 stop:763 length:735 start_codon:yes stop_codon:yes gene_type:complete
MFYERKDDEVVFKMIQEVLKKRPTYGYKRVTAMVNRDNGENFNKKRIYRLMKKNGVLLPKSIGERSGHKKTGKIVTLHSNTRWCSDGFEIHCWNGEKVYVAFALDCCDREAIDFVARKTPLLAEDVQALMIQSVEKRFNKSHTPRPIQWLSDRGSIYRAGHTQTLARSIGLTPCFTRPRCPESNGMAEALVKTIKRDYVYVNDCMSADWVIEHIAEWFEDYNEFAPHSGLGMLSPREYRSKINN